MTVLRSPVVVFASFGLSLLLAAPAAGQATDQDPSRVTENSCGVEIDAYRGGPASRLTAPSLLSATQPLYTPDARVAGVEGSVELEAVVLSDGRVGEICVVKSLDSERGLDDRAVEAARQWRFQPATLDGTAVGALVTLVIDFKLADDTGVRVAQAGADDRVTAPVLVRTVEAQYTQEAERAGIQGVVELEAVVRADGSVQVVRVTKSLDARFGLDREAIRAAEQWRFRPGTLDGEPVPTTVRLVVEFDLGDG